MDASPALIRNLPPERQRLWSALRVMRRGCDVTTLAMTAQASPQAAWRWLVLLHRAGFVAQKVSGHTRGGNILWRVTRDSGREAPYVDGHHMVDPNTRESYHIVARVGAHHPGWDLPILNGFVA